MRVSIPAAVIAFTVALLIGSALAIADTPSTTGNPASGPDRGKLNDAATPPALRVSDKPQLINGGTTDRVADLSIMSNDLPQ